MLRLDEGDAAVASSVLAFLEKKEKEEEARMERIEDRPTGRPGASGQFGPGERGRGGGRRSYLTDLLFVPSRPGHHVLVRAGGEHVGLIFKLALGTRVSCTGRRVI